MYLTTGERELQNAIDAAEIAEINARLQAALDADVLEAFYHPKLRTIRSVTVAEVIRKFGTLRVRREPLLKGDSAYSDGQLLVLSADLYDRVKAADDVDREAILGVPCRYFPLTQAMRFLA